MMKAAYPNLLPQLSAEEFAALKDDIRKHGVTYEIVIDEETGEIIDGWHRYQAAMEVGATAKQKKIKFKNEADRLRYAVKLNILRRQLTKTQTARFAVEYMLSAEEKKAKERKDEGGRTGGRGKKKNLTAKVQQGFPRQPTAAAIVAKEVGVSERLIFAAKKEMRGAEGGAAEAPLGEIQQKSKKRKPKDKTQSLNGDEIGHAFADKLRAVLEKLNQNHRNRVIFWVEAVLEDYSPTHMKEGTFV